MSPDSIHNFMCNWICWNFAFKLFCGQDTQSQSYFRKDKVRLSQVKLSDGGKIISMMDFSLNLVFNILFS